MGRLAVLLAVSLGLLAPASAEAQSCEGARRWAESCGDDEVSVEVDRCLPGGVILQTAVGGEPTLEIEVARGREGAFRMVGALGISPIAEYADWSTAPPDVRRAFEVVVACVEADPTLDLPEGQLVAGGSGPIAPIDPPWPFLPLGAALAALLALGLALRRRRPSTRAVAWAVIPPLVIALSAWLLRGVLSEPAFVHQNGQGPLWVSHALCVTPVYGPGYFEVLGLAVQLLGGEASAAVFGVQALLASLAAGAVWLIARGASVHPILSAVLCAGVAFEPALSRLGQSESYFGIIASLLLVAAGILSAGARRRRLTDPVFLLSVVAAGLLVAQAARVHPVAWVPSAMLPLVVVVGRGRTRSRLILAAASAVGIGVVAAVFAAGVIFGVSSGGVGDQWLPGLFSRVPTQRIEWGLLIGTVGGVLIAIAARGRRRGVLRGAAFFAVVVVAGITHLIGAVGPIIVTAYLLLFLPAFVATLGAGISAAVHTKRHLYAAAAALASLALASAALRAEGVLELPTDAREQAWLLAERDVLPDEATVAFLGSAGPRRRLHLPFYGECGVGGVTAVQLEADELARDLNELDRPVFWYRSSLCTTDDGRAFCDALEARYGLRPIAGTDLVAIPSMEGLGYTDGTVHVSLGTLGSGR